MPIGMRVGRTGFAPPFAVRLRLYMAAALLVVGVALSAEAINRVLTRTSEHRRDAVELARAMSMVTDREAAVAIARLTTLAALPCLREEDFAALHTQLQATARPPGNWFLLYDDTGQIVVDTLHPFGTSPAHLSRNRTGMMASAPNFLATGSAEGGGRMLWFPPGSGPELGAQVRVTAANGRHYGLVEVIQVGHLTDILKSLGEDTPWTLGFADRGGRIIAAQPTGSLDIIHAGPEQEGTILVKPGWTTTRRMAFHRSALTEGTAVVRFVESDPILISAGYVVGIIAFMLALAKVMDSTIRHLRADIARPVRKLESALRFASFRRSDAEARLAGFWDHAEDGLLIAHASRDGNVALVAANPAFWRIAGRPEPPETADWMALAAQEAAALRAGIRRCGWEGGSATFIQSFGAAGHLRQCEVRLTASGAPHGTPSPVRRVFGIVRDVTQQTRSDAALAESRGQLRQARSVAGIVPWRWTSGMGDLEWLDQPDGEPQGNIPLPGMRSVHPADRDTMLLELNSALRSGRAAHFEIRICDGTSALRFYVGSGGIVHQDGHPCLTGVLVDLTDRRNTEEGRDQAFDLFARIADTTSSVLYIRDIVEQNLIYLNRRVFAVTGYDAETLSKIGSQGLRLLVHPADIEQFDRTAAMALSLSDGAEAKRVFRLKHHDGRWRWLQASETVFARDKAGNVTQLLGSLQDITEAREAKQGLRKISAQLLHAQDHERRRIARDLHDSTAQLLAGASMSAARLQSLLGDMPQPAEEELRRLGDLVQQSQREVRTVSYLLHPPLLDDVGFRAALDWYAGGLMKQTGIAIHVHITDAIMEQRPPRDVEIALFRVVQEALSNAIRHAGCATVWVSLQPEDEQTLLLMVRDDGCGMRREVSMHPAHGGAITEFGVGIFGMSERIRQLNGSLSINDAEGGGTIVIATVKAQA